MKKPRLREVKKLVQIHTTNSSLHHDSTQEPKLAFPLRYAVS